MTKAVPQIRKFSVTTRPSRKSAKKQTLRVTFKILISLPSRFCDLDKLFLVMLLMATTKFGFCKRKRSITDFGAIRNGATHFSVPPLEHHGERPVTYEVLCVVLVVPDNLHFLIRIFPQTQFTNTPNPRNANRGGSIRDWPEQEISTRDE